MFKRRKYTDQQIVQAIETGGRSEDQVIAYMIEQNFGKISSLITSRNGSVADAEDIFQEALAALILNIKKGSFRAQSTLNTYLYSICKGMWYKKFRRYTKERDYKSGLMIDDRDLDTPEVELLDLEQKDLLNQLFDQLKTKCKEVLLFWGQGYAMAEIAERLEFSGSQVAMNKKNKCLKELHVLMEDDPTVQHLLKELSRA